MVDPSVRPPFTNLQAELIKLFARELPDKDLIAIKDMIAQYLLERTLESAAEEWDQRGYTVEDFKRKVNGEN
jgi:hypothetical protein